MSCWCDNLNGPMGLILSGALGVSHVMSISGDLVMNMIPVDICIKGMIVASFKVWMERLDGPEPEIPVYNAASLKFVTYNSLAYNYRIANECPSMQCVSSPSMVFTLCPAYAWFLRIFRHIIPALIVDGFLCLSGNKPKQVQDPLAIQ